MNNLREEVVMKYRQWGRRKEAGVGLECCCRRERNLFRSIRSVIKGRINNTSTSGLKKGGRGLRNDLRRRHSAADFFPRMWVFAALNIAGHLVPLRRRRNRQPNPRHAERLTPKPSWWMKQRDIKENNRRLLYCAVLLNVCNEPITHEITLYELLHQPPLWVFYLFIYFFTTNSTSPPIVGFEVLQTSASFPTTEKLKQLHNIQLK